MILHTKKNGSGEEAIVFLHTGLQTGETELDLQEDYFKQKYQVILPDLRGHGQSVSDNFSNYFHKTANDLADTLEKLGIQSAHIVGCSIGALVGIVFAKNHPEKIKTLTISGILPVKPVDYEVLNKKETKNIKKMLEDSKTVAYFDDIHSGNWRELLKVTQDIEWYPFEETGDLSILDMPVLYIVGEKNEHETMGTILYPKTNKNIHVAIIPFAGHTVHLDQPRMYNDIVAHFIKEKSS